MSFVLQVQIVIKPNGSKVIYNVPTGREKGHSSYSDFRWLAKQHRCAVAAVSPAHASAKAARSVSPMPMRCITEATRTPRHRTSLVFAYPRKTKSPNSPDDESG